jgi:gliding motility-associated-like protein
VVVFKAAQVNGYPLNSSKDKYLFTYRIKTDGGVISANYQQATVLGKDQASVTIPGNYTGSLWVELLSVSYDKLPLCEQSTMSQKVHFNLLESPQIIAVTRDTTVCESTEAILTVQTIASITDKHQWQAKDKSTNQWQNILITDTNFDGVTTAKLLISSVTITMSNTWFRCILSNDQGGCEVYSNPIKLNVKSTPVKPNVKSNYKLCQNESPVNLNNFVSGSNLIWFTQETGGTAIIGLPTITTNQAGIQQLYVSQKINGCEGPRALFEVEVKPIPEVLPMSNFEYCANKNTDEIIFTSNPNPFNQITQFNWSISDLSVGVSSLNGVGSIPSFMTHNSGVNNVNALVKVHAILEGCKGATKEFKITVFPSSKPQVKVVNVDINSVEVEWVPIPNVNDYEVSVRRQYQDGTWGGFISLETTSNNRSTVSNLNKHEKIEIQVKVLTSTTNACYTEAIVSAITSDCMMPEIILNPLSQKSCEGSEVTLITDVNFNGAVGLFRWQKSENGGLEWRDIQLSGQDAIDYSGSDSKELKIIKTSKGLVFRVIALDNATQLCADTSNYAGVEVFEVPSGRFTLLSNKPEVCQGEESIKMMFSANKGLAPYTFEYVINGTMVNKAKSEISDHILIPTDQPIQLTSYKFTKVTDANGCYMNTGEEIVIAVNPIPQINFNLGNNSGCSPLSISFRDPDMKPGRVVTWDFGNGKPAVLTTNEIVDNTFSSEDEKEKTYTVTMKAVEKGCSISKQQKVYLQPNPVANFELDEYTLNQYEPRITSINQSIGATKYRWSFGDGTLPVMSENIEHIYEVKPGEYNVQLIAIANGENCSDTMIRRVSIPDETIYYVPNTFTPNNDKTNNVFTPIFSSGYDPQHYSFQVFDRWGEMIFESRNPSIGWDGTYAGDEVANDVYIWKIEFKEKLTDKKHQKYGNVNLVK